MLAVQAPGESVVGCVISKDLAWKHRGLQLGLGFVVGGLSAVTGTSGPVCLLPALIALRWNIHEALGCVFAPYFWRLVTHTFA